MAVIGFLSMVLGLLIGYLIGIQLTVWKVGPMLATTEAERDSARIRATKAVEECDRLRSQAIEGKKLVLGHLANGMDVLDTAQSLTEQRGDKDLARLLREAYFSLMRQRDSADKRIPE